MTKKVGPVAPNSRVSLKVPIVNRFNQLLGNLDDLLLAS